MSKIKIPVNLTLLKIKMRFDCTVLCPTVGTEAHPPLGPPPHSTPLWVHGSHLHHRGKGFLLPNSLQRSVGGAQVEQLHLIFSRWAKFAKNPLEDLLSLVAQRSTEKSKTASSLLPQLLKQLATVFVLM